MITSSMLYYLLEGIISTAWYIAFNIIFVAGRLFRGIPDRVRPAGASTQSAGLLASFVTPVCVRGESGIPRTYGTCCLCLFLEKIPFNGRCISCSSLTNLQKHPHSKGRAAR